MKKRLIVGVLILAMALGTFAVYADTADTQNIFPFGRGNRHMEDRGMGFAGGQRFTEEGRQGFLEDREIFFKEKESLTEEKREEWFKERTEYKRTAIKEALAKGNITEEQAKKLEESLQEREEYHRDNGFNNEFCHGQGFGMGSKDGIGFGMGLKGGRGKAYGHGKGMMRGNGL